MTLTRRAALASAAALLAAPSLSAQPQPRPAGDWARTADRARGLDQLHALVISQGGREVFAEAFRGPGVSRPVNVKSVSKTLVAALLGAALDRGEVAGVGATLGEVAPGLIPPGADPRVRDLTLENLVTMQTGLERTSGAGYGAFVSSRDWVAYVLTRPMIREPGRGMLYSTGSFHVLGAALAEASGESLLAQARERLGEPLGIEIPAWTRDPQGFYLGGNEMALSPRAMVAFGEMYRRGGQGVLSPGWVEASFQDRTRSPFSGMGYGYGWFLTRFGGLGGLGGRRAMIARGYGGQVICIVPDLELTVAITSDAARPARSGGYFGDLTDLLGETLVPEAEA